MKTRRFKDEVYVGDPINAVKIFNEKEVDELFLFDIHASKERRRPDFSLIESIVSEAFMPVGYGGGVRSVEDVRTLLRLGVEKVALNTAAIEDLSLIRQLSDAFGAQCVVGVIDVKRDWLGRPQVFSHASRTPAERHPGAYMRTLVDAGAGELLLQSVDRDGTLSGLDPVVLALSRTGVSVPVLVAGGTRDADDIARALASGGPAGIVVGARFVFQGPHNAVLISYLSDAERRAV